MATGIRLALDESAPPEKQQALFASLGELTSLLVAFSGGADSAYLAWAAHRVLGPWGVDSDLRRWGMKLAEHGDKRGKKRAVIAVARKLAVLLHRLWVSGDVYVPLRPSGRPRHESAR